MEMHYSPGTPAYVIERCERISANASKLVGMEIEGNSDSDEYKRIETQIRTDLYELEHPTVEDVIQKMIERGGPFTGIGGTCRDLIIDPEEEI